MGGVGYIVKKWAVVTVGRVSHAFVNGPAMCHTLAGLNSSL